MKLRFSRPVVHGLICALLGGAVAGLWRLEQKNVVGDNLTSWEYRFRDAIAVSGRFLPPDPHLAFLAMDNSSVNFSDLDLQTLYANIPHASPERHALDLIAAHWPYSRELYGLIAERLLEAGARGVIFDVNLPKPGQGDALFRAVIARHPTQIIIGANFETEVIGPGIEVPTFNLPTETAIPNDTLRNPYIGYFNFWGDFDSIIRAARYHTTLELLEAGMRGIDFPPPVALEADTPTAVAMRAAHWFGDFPLARPFESHLFRFSGPPGTYVPVPFYQIFIPTYWKENFGSGALLRDKVIIFGPSANFFHDDHPTPFGAMAGSEIHLQSLNALIHHAFLREWPDWSVYLLVFGAALVSFLATVLLGRISLRVAAFIGLAALFLVGVKLAYDHASTIVPGIPPTLAFALSGLASFIYDYTREKLEKVRTRRTLESYVSKEAARDILDNPESFLNALGGQRTKVALIMTDLRGFTTLSEQMDSHQLVKQLNEYLTLMVGDVFAFKGSVDKFIGDAVLAVWGSLSSVNSAEDAKNALRAALQMQVSLAKLNADWTSRGLLNFAMGCGLNYGEVVFGNIGSAQKKELTVIGDTVNVTARLEGLTKDYGCNLLLGEAAAALVRDEFRLQYIDRVAVKGKKKALKLYTVIGATKDPLDQIVQDCLGLHEEACKAYRARDWSEATQKFQRCLELRPNDKLPAIYLERCETFLQKPPPEEWEGIWVAEHK